MTRTFCDRCGTTIPADNANGVTFSPLSALISMAHVLYREHPWPDGATLCPSCFHWVERDATGYLRLAEAPAKKQDVYVVTVEVSGLEVLMNGPPADKRGRQRLSDLVEDRLCSARHELRRLVGLEDSP